jgi:hypothetical protein
MHLFVNNMADSDISDYEFYDDDLSMMPVIIPQFHLQDEFPHDEHCTEENDAIFS